MTNTVVALPLCSVPIPALGSGTDLAETIIGIIGPSSGIVNGCASIDATEAIDATTHAVVASAACAITASLAPSAGLTANNSNYKEFSVYRRPAAGGSPVLVATMTTQVSGTYASGSWTAWKSLQMTMVGGNDLAVGDTITILSTSTGSGAATPAFTCSLFGGNSWAH